MASDLLGAGNLAGARGHAERLDRVVPTLRLWLRSRLGGVLRDVLAYLLLTFGVWGGLVDVHKLRVLTWVAMVVDLGLGEPLLLCQD